MKPDYIHDSFPMNRQDLMNVIYGACFFASGGGGPIEMGLEFLEKIQQDVYLINTDKLDDNKKAIAVADMGSPNAVRQGLGYTAPINAFEVLQHHIEEKEGKRVSYLLPMELGALNTLIPFYVASQLENVSVINAGPCGRSVPQLDMTLLNVANVPICPAAIASDADPNTRDYRSRMFFDVDATTLEDEARNLINTYGQVGGIGCYPMAGADLNRLKPGNEHKLIQGSIGLAWNIGQQILKYEGLDKLSMLLASFSCELRFDYPKSPPFRPRRRPASLRQTQDGNFKVRKMFSAYVIAQVRYNHQGESCRRGTPLRSLVYFA